MSRILIRCGVRFAVPAVSAGILAAGVACVALGCAVAGVALVAAAVIFAVAGAANRAVIRKNVAPRKLLGLDVSAPRNFDVLVVGEPCDVSKFVPAGARCAPFFAPNRTLFASFVIFRHVFSLLREDGGKVVFVAKRKNVSSERLSIFDVPFLHRITIAALGLKPLVRRRAFPLLFAPIDSLKILLSVRGNAEKFLPPPPPESRTVRNIRQFCGGRGIDFEIRLF